MPRGRPNKVVGTVTTQAPKLTGEALKTLLWETMIGVNNDTVAPSKANAIASQSRAILSTINLQLKIHEQMGGAGTPIQIESFSK